MRFVMINLILVCLLLLGIGYLAFGSVKTAPNPEPHAHAFIHCTDIATLDRISQNIQKTPQTKQDRVFNFRERIAYLSLFVK